MAQQPPPAAQPSASALEQAARLRAAAAAHNQRTGTGASSPPAAPPQEEFSYLETPIDDNTQDFDDAPPHVQQAIINSRAAAGTPVLHQDQSAPLPPPPDSTTPLPLDPSTQAEAMYNQGHGLSGHQQVAAQQYPEQLHQHQAYTDSRPQQHVYPQAQQHPYFRAQQTTPHTNSPPQQATSYATSQPQQMSPYDHPQAQQTSQQQQPAQPDQAYFPDQSQHSHGQPVLSTAFSSPQQQQQQQPQPQQRQHQDEPPLSPGPVPMKSEQDFPQPSPARPDQDPYQNDPKLQPYTPYQTLGTGAHNATSTFYSPDTLRNPTIGLAAHEPGQKPHPNMKPSTMGQQASWTASLCSCGPDVSTCLTGLFCPCVLYARTNYRLAQKSRKADPTDMLGHSDCSGHCILFSVACGFQGLLTSILSARVRHAYGVTGEGTVAEFCKGCCCCCCAVVQAEREVKVREKDRARFAGPSVSAAYAPRDAMAYRPVAQ